MKVGPLLACSMAVLALAACNKKSTKAPAHRRTTTHPGDAGQPAARRNLGRCREHVLGGRLRHGQPQRQGEAGRNRLAVLPALQEVRGRRLAPAGRKICEARQCQLGIPPLRHSRADRRRRKHRRALQRHEDLLPPHQGAVQGPAGLEAQIQAAPQDKINEIQNLPTNQVFVTYATLLGLQDWAAARGLPQAKSNQCLADQKMIDQRGADYQRRQHPISGILRDPGVRASTARCCRRPAIGDA